MHFPIVAAAAPGLRLLLPPASDVEQKYEDPLTGPAR
jgi:hypothetical protein